MDGRVMGIDHGSVRIGIALSDSLRLFARPVEVVTRKSREEDFALLRRLIQAETVIKIVIGLPTDSQGRIGSQAASVIRWARHLAQAIDVPVFFWDESYSSVNADEVARMVGKRRAKSGTKPELLDHVAAATILQEYLHAAKSEDEPGTPLEAFSDIV